MSTDTSPADDGTGTDDRPADPYSLLEDAARKARRLDIPAGRGRAAWVLDQWRREMPGEGQVVFGGPYGAGAYRCDECGAEPSDHPGVRILLPSDAGGGAAILAGPYCPGCAIGLLRTALR